mgnify:CR=1 FL=1
MRTCRRPSPSSFGDVAQTPRAPTRSAAASRRTARSWSTPPAEGRAIVTTNVFDFLRLAREAVATNTEHAGIVLVPSSFRGDEYEAIAHAILEEVKPYPHGLEGVVLYVKRRDAPGA